MGNVKYAALLIPFLLTLAFFLNPTFLSSTSSATNTVGRSDQKLLISAKKILLGRSEAHSVDKAVARLLKPAASQLLLMTAVVSSLIVMFFMNDITENGER